MVSTVKKIRTTPNKLRKTTNNKGRAKALPLSGAEPKYTWDPWGSTGKVHDNCYDYAFGSFSKKRTQKSVPGARSLTPSNNLTFKTCKGISKLILSDNPGNVYHMTNPSARCRPGFYKVMCFVAPTNDFGNFTGDFHFLKQVGSVRYKVRPGDTVKGLAKFFRVKEEVILKAIQSPKKAASPNNGRISNSNSNLGVLQRLNEINKTSKRPAPGYIIEFPVNLWSHKQGWAGGPLLVDASGKTIVDPRRANMNYKPGFHYSTFCSAWGVRRGMARTGNNSNR